MHPISWTALAFATCTISAMLTTNHRQILTGIVDAIGDLTEMRVLWCIFLMATNGAVFAQATGTVNPNVAPAEPSIKEDAPPGGCMPIGLTASGEIVFPFQCKGFIEQHREKGVEQKPPFAEDKPSAIEQNPAAVEEKPAAAEHGPMAVEEKRAIEQSAAEGLENTQSIDKSAETVSLSKRVKDKPRGRSIGSAGCQRYRTYDPESASYRGYDGRRHSCQ